VGGRTGLQIISNFAVERRAIATFRLPVEKLACKGKVCFYSVFFSPVWKIPFLDCFQKFGVFLSFFFQFSNFPIQSGEDVARGILEGYAMACADSYRAVTHNKGIMNGIDAAAIALGQVSLCWEAQGGKGGRKE
jgi:hypothetical protein